MRAIFIYLILLTLTGLATASRFTRSGDVVTDTVTGLEWHLVPNGERLTWYEGYDWIEGLGDGWHMPTLEELMQLYNAGITTDTWGPFYTGNNSSWVRFKEVRDPNNLTGYRDTTICDVLGFSSGTVHPRDRASSHTVFAVRFPY